MTKFYRNSKFNCLCGIRVGICEAVDHPKKMEWRVGDYGDFLEGWALGKYHHRKGKWGQLVYDFKWHPRVGQQQDMERKENSAQQVYDGMSYFWKNYIKGGLKPFNYVYAMPGSTGKHPSLAQALANKFAEEGITILPEFIKSNTNLLGSAKEINGFKSRADYLEQKFIWNEKPIPKDAWGVLVLDDVYETGATLRRAAKILKDAQYTGQIFFMVAAYKD